MRHPKSRRERGGELLGCDACTYTRFFGRFRNIWGFKPFIFPPIPKLPEKRNNTSKSPQSRASRGSKHTSKEKKKEEKNEINGWGPTCKEHPPRQHLRQDAAGRPHVDGFGVVVGREEEARRAVPLGDQAFRKVTLEEQRENCDGVQKSPRFAPMQFFCNFQASFCCFCS